MTHYDVDHSGNVPNIAGRFPSKLFVDHGPWLENPKLKAQNKVSLKAQAFDLRDVRLLDGPFQRAMELDRQYLLSLEPERLLHTFRVNAGLPSPAKPLGGWEQPENGQRSSELRGHFAGHYLSGCALAYASACWLRPTRAGRA